MIATPSHPGLHSQDVLGLPRDGGSVVTGKLSESRSRELIHSPTGMMSQEVQ